MTTDTREALALLPCPFCGNAKGIAVGNEAQTDNSGGYFIACPACHASTGLRFACGEDPVPLLIEQWNRRAALATQPAQPSAQPLLVRDVAEMLGIDSSMPVCKSLVALGYPPRSVNMAVTPDEAVAVAKHLAAQPSAQGEAVALPQDVLDFLREVATQPKSKPDYWSSCGQCESNQSKAEDLLASAPAAPAQPSAQGEAWNQLEIWPIHGVRVQDCTVIISAKDNNAARYMCGVLVKIFEDQRRGK